MMNELNFIAIDFETATNSRASICEVGICVVRNGEVTETHSWLVRPEDNLYSYYNIRVHGITPDDTENAPEFSEVWNNILLYLDKIPVLVAHNASFDISCIRESLHAYQLDKPDIDYYCTLRAARHNYKFKKNTLGALCEQFNIPEGKHHRAGDDAEMCARLFLKELEDLGSSCLESLDYCKGKL